MPVAIYGIYLAYAPAVNLRSQGLGRYLASFLKAASRRSDVRFVLACPSWSKDDLLKLCEAEGIRSEAFDILTPPTRPMLLRTYQWVLKYRRRPSRRRRIADWAATIRLACERHRLSIERHLATARSVAELTPWLVYAAALIIVSLPILIIVIATRLFTGAFLDARRRLFEASATRRHLARLRRLTTHPQQDALVLRLYRFMEESETSILTDKINALTNVEAWYSPTAFWPSFNRIEAPHLMCVPDVVLTDFPVGFSRVGGTRFLMNFKAVETAIEQGEHFIAYSDDVKWNTLVQRYGVDPDRIDVVHHAVNDLRRSVDITGFADNHATSRRYAQTLFTTALQKATNIEYAAAFANHSVRFLFFPSQFRPSKNLPNLLLAYDHLLRRRYLGHKLILTGNPKEMPEIGALIRRHDLERDVLCLPGLTVPELAACYRLADVAVNPSLSEGGCPFTFGEAISVGTPVVMARIPVTEEVITDPRLQNMMLFDPYRWRDMADRIEWAVQNREVLKSAQIEAYNRISSRSWDDVVADHIAILRRISAPDSQPTVSRP
jgi:glycosyltransferase involved in cell wall biosynthesis